MRTNSAGQPYDYCDLKGRASPFLTYQYRRWYPIKSKEVPEDLVLVPASLAHWFMNDGTSVHDGAVTVRVSMATHCFNEHSIQVLEEQLSGFGFHTGRRHHVVGRGAGIIVAILQDSVNRFMETIEPYVVEPYRYKIKYRR